MSEKYGDFSPLIIGRPKITINKTFSMVNIHEKYFSSYDIFLSSVLVYFNFKIEILDKSDKQKVKFIFLREQGLDEMAQKYWAHELRVEPQAFAATLKSLKNRIYSD